MLAWRVRVADRPADLTCRTRRDRGEDRQIAIFVFILIRCSASPSTIARRYWPDRGGSDIRAWGGVMFDERLAIGAGGPDFAESSDLPCTWSPPLIGAMFFTRLARPRFCAAGRGPGRERRHPDSHAQRLRVGSHHGGGRPTTAKAARREGLPGILPATCCRATGGSWLVGTQETILDYQQNAPRCCITYWKAARHGCPNPAESSWAVSLRVQITRPRTASARAQHADDVSGRTRHTRRVSVRGLGGHLIVAFEQTARWKDVLLKWSHTWPAACAFTSVGMPCCVALVGYLACGMFTTRPGPKASILVTGAA